MEQQQQAIEPYFSTADLAGLPGMPGTERGVRKKSAADRWTWRDRAGRGGGREFPLSCLPAETQAALAARHIAGAAPASLPVPSREEALAAQFDARPDKIKAEARARLAIVQEFHALLGRGFARASVITAVTRERQISEATLQRHLAAVRGAPEQQWIYLLAPAYVGRTATADLSAAAWEYLKADYLRAERPSAAACIHRLERAAASHGWTLPSRRTLLRRLQALPRAIAVMAREGKTAALQLYPAQQRSKAALHALEIINGDGYLHNVWVAFADGEIRRAKTWFWQDVYSSKVIGWRTDKTEHTDVIRLSFGDVVESLGIPDAVVVDNTLAAANKTMSGGVKTRFRFKVKEDEPLGVFPLLGVRVRWATPGHGQAKPVERVFGVGGMGELIDKAPEFAGAWTGGSPVDKPEYDGKTRTVPIEQLEAVIAREIAAFNAREGRRGAIHQGRSFDAVFAESYARSTIRKATEAQRRLWLLATEPVQANSRDGTIALDAGRVVGERLANRFWHTELVEYAGRKVVARFDPKRLHEGVHVYTLDGRWICFAECVDPAAFNDADAGREHTRNRKTFLRATKLALASERRMDALEAAKFLPGADKPAPVDATIPAPALVRGSFRDPLERPRVAPVALDAEAAVVMQQLEAAEAAPQEVNVHELRSDTQKHAHWTNLDRRRGEGVVLSDADEQFWKAWQDSTYFRFQRELDDEFETRIAAANGG